MNLKAPAPDTRRFLKHWGRSNHIIPSGAVIPVTGHASFEAHQGLQVIIVAPDDIVVRAVAEPHGIGAAPQQAVLFRELHRDRKSVV